MCSGRVGSSRFISQRRMDRRLTLSEPSARRGFAVHRVKMLDAEWYPISTEASLAVVGGVIGVWIALSLWKGQEK